MGWLATMGWSSWERLHLVNKGISRIDGVRNMDIYQNALDILYILGLILVYTVAFYLIVGVIGAVIAVVVSLVLKSGSRVRGKNDP